VTRSVEDLLAPLDWESYEDTGAVRKPRKLVTVPLAGAAYIKARTGNRCLIHALELDDAGEPVRVLCGKVKLANVLDDATQYDRYPLDCDACVRKFGADE
jgi:hypothetical protein